MLLWAVLSENAWDWRACGQCRLRKKLKKSTQMLVWAVFGRTCSRLTRLRPVGHESNTPLLKAATGKKLAEVSGHMPVSAKCNINILKIRHSEHSTKFKSAVQGGNPLQARKILYNVLNVLFSLYLCCILLKPACVQTPPPISFLWPLLIKF